MIDACLDLTEPAAEIGTVYIIRFDSPLGNPAKAHGTAQYYIGWCKAGGLERRLNQHRAGLGAKLTAAAAEKEIGFELLVCYAGTRADERRAKNYKNARLFVQNRSWERKQRGPIPF
jgi:predicted GIY-YIG superfamily endonuclease